MRTVTRRRFTLLTTFSTATVTASVGALRVRRAAATTPGDTGTGTPTPTPVAGFRAPASGSVTIALATPTRNLLITPPTTPPSSGLPASFTLAVDGGADKWQQPIKPRMLERSIGAMEPASSRSAPSRAITSSRTSQVNGHVYRDPPFLRMRQATSHRSPIDGDGDSRPEAGDSDSAVACARSRQFADDADGADHVPGGNRRSGYARLTSETGRPPTWAARPRSHNRTRIRRQARSR